jgi:hypothetical protein
VILEPLMLKKTLQYILLVIFGAGTAVVGVELIGRIVPIDRLPGSLSAIVQKMQLHETVYRRDVYLQYVIDPRADHLFQHREFTYRVKPGLKLGQAGFRGNPPQSPVWGIALGDSFTFGMGVEHDSTWVTQLAKLTRKEIVNLGVPGWGPQQYTRALERFGVALKPKVVLYTLYRNDLQDALLFDQWSRKPPYRQSIDTFLRLNSIVFNFVRFLAGTITPGTERIVLENYALEFNSKMLKHGLVADRIAFTSAWSIIEREISLAIDYSHAINAIFVLLYLPPKEEVYWEFIKEREIDLGSYDHDIDILRSHVVDFCKLREISCLDLTPAFRLKAANGMKLYYSDDSHWKEAGNRLAAEEIYRFIRNHAETGPRVSVP